MRGAEVVHAHDVARAFRLALEHREVEGCALNIGSGAAISINDVADTLSRILGKEHLRPEVSGRFRAGDVRHCFADISRAEALLGYRPEVAFTTGVAELAGWLAEQSAVDRAGVATAELHRRGLTL